MTKDKAIDILHKMSEDNFYGTHVQGACKMAVEALSKCALPSNLDEAAEKFARDDAARMWDIENKTEEEIVIAAFKAGAELMACLALTPDDIKLIIKIHYELVFKDTTGVKVGDVPSEVLRRFNELRKK